MKLKFLKNRHIQIGILFFFLFMALFGRLAYLQLSLGDEYAVISQDVITRIIPEKGMRGTIYSQDGEKLAWNRLSFDVDLYYYELMQGDGNASILNTINIIESRGGQIQYNLPLKLDSNGKIIFNWEAEKHSQKLSKAQISKKEEDWKSMHRLKQELSAEESFNKLREIYGIGEEYTIHESLSILNIWNEMKLVGFRAYRPVTIARDIDLDTATALEEVSSEQKGVVVSPSSIRDYPYGETASHILGYIGKITEEEWNRPEGYYKENNYNPSVDLVGRSEMEMVMEEYLRGIDGGRRIEVDSLGRTIRTLEEKKPVPGNNVYLTIDLELQKATENALKDTMAKIRSGEMGEAYPNANIGSAVVLNVNTGAILALANEPAFDPNFSVTGSIDNEVWSKYNPVYKKKNNPDEIDLDPTLPRPMLNLAIRGAYPPGSIFKMLTGVAALEENIITPSTKIIDQGIYTKVSKNGPACWLWHSSRSTHGAEDIISALRDSCNYYFYTIGHNLGIDRIEKYARMFGLGEKTGIELPGEAEGVVAGKTHTNEYLKNIVSLRLADAAGHSWGELDNEQKESYRKTAQQFVDTGDWKTIEKGLETLNIDIGTQKAYDIFYRYINDNKWMEGKTLSAAIGQAENTFTPIQMASYMATLANGGTRYKTYLVDRVEDVDGDTILRNEPQILGTISIDSANHKALMEGMRAVVSDSYEDIYGTGSRYFRDFPIEIGGKTGTSQFKGHDPYAWFVSFAPFDNPEIAVAIMIGQGGSGSYAALVCREIYEHYFELEESVVQ